MRRTVLGQKLEDAFLCRLNVDVEDIAATDPLGELPLGPAIFGARAQPGSVERQAPALLGIVVQQTVNPHTPQKGRRPPRTSTNKKARPRKSRQG